MFHVAHHSRTHLLHHFTVAHITDTPWVAFYTSPQLFFWRTVVILGRCALAAGNVEWKLYRPQIHVCQSLSPVTQVVWLFDLVDFSFFLVRFEEIWASSWGLDGLDSRVQICLDFSGCIYVRAERCLGLNNVLCMLGSNWRRVIRCFPFWVKRWQRWFCSSDSHKMWVDMFTVHMRVLSLFLDPWDAVQWAVICGTVKRGAAEYHVGGVPEVFGLMQISRGLLHQSRAAVKFLEQFFFSARCPFVALGMCSIVRICCFFWMVLCAYLKMTTAQLLWRPWRVALLDESGGCYRSTFDSNTPIIR